MQIQVRKKMSLARLGVHSPSKCLAWVKKRCHFWLDQKEKESWSSVGGFGMETSNFALNRCLRVSIDRFFDARSNHGLRISLSAL